MLVVVGCGNVQSGMLTSFRADDDDDDDDDGGGGGVISYPGGSW